jgi:hypothetical protein
MEEKVDTKPREGKVETEDGRITQVRYHFISDDTIYCRPLMGGDGFYTHYKSLVVER